MSELFLSTCGTWICDLRDNYLGKKGKRWLFQANENTGKKVHGIFENYKGVEIIVQGERKLEKRLERWAKGKLW